MEEIQACDPGGDLILRLGSETAFQSLRVSAKVISLASPVFNTLLNSNFREGQPASPGSDRSIKLHDDDPEAMALLCQTLHFWGSGLTEISFDLLERFAILCDKYQCANVMQPLGQTWLRKLSYKGQDHDHNMQILHISYVFRDSTAFWRSSNDLAKSIRKNAIDLGFLKEDPVSSHTAQGLDLLPTGVRGKPAAISDLLLFVHGSGKQLLRAPAALLKLPLTKDRSNH